MDGWKEGDGGGWMDEWMDGGRWRGMDGWMEGGMEGVEGDGWMDGWMKQPSICPQVAHRLLRKTDIETKNRNTL